MSTPENTSDAVEQAALGPRRVQVGNETVEQFSIKELIEADKFKKGEAAAEKNHAGVRFRKMKFGGTG